MCSQSRAITSVASGNRNAAKCGDARFVVSYRASKTWGGNCYKIPGKAALHKAWQPGETGNRKPADGVLSAMADRVDQQDLGGDTLAQGAKSSGAKRASP